MKHWMAVHTFVDENAKLSYHDYIAEIEKLKTKGGKSFTQSDWAKESTGEQWNLLGQLGITYGTSSGSKGKQWN